MSFWNTTLDKKISVYASTKVTYKNDFIPILAPTEETDAYLVKSTNLRGVVS